jgi:hypothetical protein
VTAPTNTWPEFPPAPTDLASAKAMMSFAADAGLRGMIPEKQVQACVKACAEFIRFERFTEQIRALTKEIAALKKATAKPTA